MSINKYEPHLLILPEDDANRQIANGFILNPSLNGRAIQILPTIGGWIRVVEKFKKNHVDKMREYPLRRVLLIIDFDNQLEIRMNNIKSQVPDDLEDRLFILGSLSEPEDLRTNIGKSFERIGIDLSKECVDNTRTVWGHPLLEHNNTELDRMVSFVKPFLFSNSITIS